MLFLIISLLLAPALGLMHSTVHVSATGFSAPSAHLAAQPGRAAVAAQAALSRSLSSSHQAGWTAALFSRHASDADCRLYDQASHGSAALQVIALILPMALPSFAVAIFQGEALARWAALFDARGPPLTH